MPYKRCRWGTPNPLLRHTRFTVGVCLPLSMACLSLPVVYGAVLIEQGFTAKKLGLHSIREIDRRDKEYILVK